MSTEFVVEYEENRWEPGRWKELQRVTGNQATAELKLYGNLNYQFRVYAVNAIGPGPPSEPTERHKTPPAGETSSYLLKMSLWLCVTCQSMQVLVLKMASFLFCKKMIYTNAHMSPKHPIGTQKTSKFKAIILIKWKSVGRYENCLFI